MNIIERINTYPDKFSPEHIPELAVDLVSHFDDRLRYLSQKAFNSEGTSRDLAHRAFREMAYQSFSRALDTFLFTYQHWRDNRDVAPYMMSVINRLQTKTSLELQGISFQPRLICTACKHFGLKEVLFSEGDTLRCNYCVQKVEILTNVIKDDSLKPIIRSRIETELELRSKFARHSKKGHKCPDCSKFIPESVKKEHIICCPYPDCIFFDNQNDLETMSHPSSLMSSSNLSLDEPFKKSGDEGNEGSLLDVKLNNISFSTDSPEDFFSIKEVLQLEIGAINDVINEQVAAVNRSGHTSTMIQKLIMYEAFKQAIANDPEGMISYLAHTESPPQRTSIQARIFQEYVKIMENYLPFTMKRGDRSIDIVDLTDPNLALFEGLSSYEATVNKNNIIPNNTKEQYIGKRKYKKYGACFIGKLIDVKNSKEQSLMPYVIEYDFNSITMDPTVTPGEEVTVTHYRILSHYQMNSMVFLQRIRRSIVDKVYFKLNKSKRK